jgi:mannan endo-1,4-beta-mannosidase
MFKRLSQRIVMALLLLASALLQSIAALPAAAQDPQTSIASHSGDDDKSDLHSKFVQREGSELELNGRKFNFGGTNNYYLEYSSTTMVDNLLNTAASNDFKVVRTWGFLDIGNQDGSGSIDGTGKKNGIYFQYWNGSAPAYNDGADGLQHLDYVVAKAGQVGIKLVIPLTNNWSAFGGIDQYVAWRGGQYHDQFYSDELIRSWYKAWISHLLNHVNTYTGLVYKNDPTIMTWELGNEPRCKGSGLYPPSSSCSTSTLTNWADEMSTYIKHVDKHHLVSMGDEGFYCTLGATDWTENCGEGIDEIALTRLKNIDVMSMHLYPDGWNKDVNWANTWIARHIKDAKANHKAFMLGEYGLKDQNTRNPVYKEWTDTVLKAGGNGALFWMLADKQDDGTYYPDYDGYTVYCTSPVCTNLINFAKRMQGARDNFPPVADNDGVSTPFNTPVTFSPASNDTASGWCKVVSTTIDLDTTTAGQQTTKTITGQGTFQLQTDGSVLFTPVATFASTVQLSYTVLDSWGRISNPATIKVTVQPNPLGALMLFSFEDGTEGWDAANWQSPVPGTVAQNSAFHTDGAYSLQVNATNGAWFGLDLSNSFNLTGKTHFKFDIQTGATGTSQNVAFKVGDSWEWCQGNWGYINAGTTTTVDLDLTQNYQCSSSKPLDLTKIQAIYFWFSAGTFYIDAIRAE